MARRKPKAEPPPESAPEFPLRLEWRSPQDLAENPANWKTHPATQVAALTDVIAEVGWAGACLYNQTTGRLIDGHARRTLALEHGTPVVPVLIGSWTEAQEKLILATLDPLAAASEPDPAKLAEILSQIETESESLAELLAGLTSADDGQSPTLKQLEIKSPPKMTWVLFGIQTVQFGQVAETIEKLAALPGTICETTVSDGVKQEN